MGTVAIICIAVAVIAICIVLAIIVYHQMLLYNEINKRLLLLTQESIEKERITQEELNRAIQDLDKTLNETTIQQPIDEETFNPHTFHDSDLD